jgi:selenocysteine lyase/cysteine desulfurase
MKNDEIHLRHDLSARAELGCPHFPGIFAMGASVALMRETGLDNIQTRVLELNRRLTSQLNETDWEVLSPVANEQSRSAETLVKAEFPQKLVTTLASQKIIVTEKPQGIRVATDYFNNEDDVDQLVTALKNY